MLTDGRDTLPTSSPGYVATTERSVKARGKTVYIDCLQNILGKTLATAYSARASDYAGVSTPLTWKEIDEGIDRRDFTITTAPYLARFAEVNMAGDSLVSTSMLAAVNRSPSDLVATGTGTGRFS